MLLLLICVASLFIAFAVCFFVGSHTSVHQALIIMIKRDTEISIKILVDANNMLCEISF